MAVMNNNYAANPANKEETTEKKESEVSGTNMTTQSSSGLERSSSDAESIISDFTTFEGDDS